MFFFLFLRKLFIVGCTFYKSHMIATLCMFFLRSSFQIFRYLDTVFLKVAIITIEQFNIGFCLVNC